MKEINKKDFGEFVCKKRKEKNMTQKDIAEKLYVSVQAVSKWERGKSLPDISLLMPLAKILDVKLVNLLEAREEKTEDSQKIENLLEKIVEINKEDEIHKRKEKLRELCFWLLHLSL
ncbi:DNA-binding helix-turn-helix protein [Anaerococcus hydrogenalis DSM 7454]|uniref:DNA-binding helix-turn-helix protein n=1 Tax=Anaerococcus hydrogenalis DSM 7454 TaxID=561177 RepID=B6W9Q3_9FIRM|nr:helix-turn-helix transcriptional regulator [Anaerococcus hydrogenalis]EEB35872.1 DNA-binding helix-turn-helix protein [Anaerococcus hydrogenalis DSM 7454]